MRETKNRSPQRRIAAVVGALTLGVIGVGGVAAPAIADDIVPGTTGKIIVHKHANQSGTSETQNPQGTGGSIPSDPIKGVEFTVYKIDGVDLGTTAGWDIVHAWSTTAPTIVTGATPTVDGRTTTLTEVLSPTNATGVATSGTLPIGAYVVVETGHPANVTTVAAPFVVTIPTPYGNSWVYDVNVYPKNTVSPLAPTKAVSPQTDLGLGSTASFPVTTPIRNLATPTNFSHYWVQDVLAAGLTGGTVSSVTIDGVAVPASYYTVENATSANGNMVTLSFNQAGLAFLKTQGDKSLVTTFTATVSAVGSINNKAYFSADTVVAPTPPATPTPPVTDPSDPAYPGKPGFPGDESNTVTTNWGDVRISKVDSVTKTGLTGAEFQVYAATAATSYPGAAADCKDAVATGSPITSGGLPAFPSGAGGVVTIPGLFVSDSTTAQPHRCYVIVETVAPLGYILDATPRGVAVTTGATTGYDITVDNTQISGVTLPMTGSDGIIVFSVAGAALVALGLIVATASRRRRSHTA